MKLEFSIYPLVSIVIPVYNIELWIERAINSVISQCYNNIELIVVDDCSEDNSILIIRELLVDVNFSVKYINHTQNRGLSAARNSGIDTATGDYILFLDGDDALADNAIDSFISSVRVEDEYDYIIGNYKVLYSDDSNYISKRYDKRVEYCGNDEIIRAFVEEWIPIMAWNKLVKRDFILSNNLYFKEGILHEDELWSFTMILNSKKVLMLGDTTYSYFVREGSIMTSPEKTIKKVESMSEIFKSMVSYSSNLSNSILFSQYLERFAFKCYIESGNLKSRRGEFYKDIRNTHLKLRDSVGLRHLLLKAHCYLPIPLGYLYCRIICKLYQLR